ncbi:hypothetical protein [Reyranella sp.]|uniref:hypothetical protein n=1 Tax=Reyranella sp. TaxID=1929291 RepID=UPI003784267F
MRVHTDAGLIGHGEVCPLGPSYLPAYANGVRTGLAELAPHLIGRDPRQLGIINRIMDQQLKGHPYVKSALDIARIRAVANGYNTVSIAAGGPQQRGGYVEAPVGPGLGVVPYLDVLGEPVLTIG